MSEIQYTPRTLEQAVLRASDSFPAVLVTGPRQVGKTTLLRHMGEEAKEGPARSYASLDDLQLRALAKEDPRLFLAQHPPPVLIDEIQYAPELLSYIKLAVDADRQPGAYWLTGSQHFHLMEGVKESLAGRIAVLTLLGFSQPEAQGHPTSPPFLPTAATIRTEHSTTATGRAAPSPDEVFARILTGSMPELHRAGGPDLRMYLSSYLQTYLQRDVRDLTQVGNLETFTRFVRACAARTAQLLNLSDLASDVGISPSTAREWLSILEASFQVHLLRPYHSNQTKRLVKAPKLYFLDTGLLCYLTGWTSSETLMNGAAAGAVFETFVVTEILKSWWHNGEEPPLYFYRDRDRREIDLVFDRDGTLHPVEIKKAATPKPSWISHFTALKRLGKPVGEGAVVCLAPAPAVLSEGVTALHCARV